MNLQDIGAILKTEREKRGLSHDDVASQLKINPRLLAALEAGDIAALPHQAYVRGFVRSYAALLGMDQEEIQSLLSGQPAGDAPLAEGAHANEAPARDNGSGNGSGGRLFIILLLLAAIAGGIWWAWDNGHLDFLQMKKEEPTALDQSLPSADVYLAERDMKRQAEPAAPKPEVDLPPENIAEAPAEAEPVPTVQQAPENQADEVKPAADSTEARGAEANPGQHKLIITATEECWVHSNADKTDTRQFSLRKGDTFALTFAKSLELKFGNAGGVRLRYDGKDLPPPGTSGQVRTLTFPPKEETGR